MVLNVIPYRRPRLWPIGSHKHKSAPLRATSTYRRGVRGAGGGAGWLWIVRRQCQESRRTAHEFKVLADGTSVADELAQGAFGPRIPANSE